MWLYEQFTGYLISSTGKRMEPPGYAGHGAGLNNPLMQAVPNVGPLPCGFYTIEAPIEDPHVGVYALPLIPELDNEMFGRSAFFIHGDDIAEPDAHDASDGCIVQTRMIRQAVWNSLDHQLQVIDVQKGDLT